MNSLRSFVLLTVVTFLSAPVGMAQEKVTEQLGKVTFPTSCDPKVQAQFERGVAMLHSYWFTKRARCSTRCCSRIPTARWPTGAIAVDLLGNSLAGPPAGKKRAGGLGGAREGARDRRENRSASATGSRR